MELPFRLLQPFLGARIIKTGIAVFLSLAVFTWFGSSYATFAAVAAILAIQPSVNKAREVLRQQLLGNLVAGGIATAIGLWLPINPGTMALGAILVLGLLNQFKLSEAAGLAVVVILFIMERPEHDFLLYTVARMGVIAGGMAIGFLVNRYIRPPDVSSRARDEIKEGAKEIDRFLQRLIASISSPEHYSKEQIKQDAGAAQKHLTTARTFLDLSSGESQPRRLLVLRKAYASMWVFTEAIMDIHKLLLEIGGLEYGPERDAVVSALQAAGAYKTGIMQAALDGAQPDPAANQRFEAAMAALQERVERLVDRRETRLRGLALHGVLAHIRHMGWRMSSLYRLLTSPRD
ncbi:MAG: FUSC family protein [Bacillota bacterium]